MIQTCVGYPTFREIRFKPFGAKNNLLHTTKLNFLWDPKYFMYSVLIPIQIFISIQNLE